MEVIKESSIFANTSIVKATKVNNTTIQLEFDNEAQRESLAKHLSYRIPGAEHTVAYKTKKWGGMKCFLTPANRMKIGFFKALFPQHSLVCDKNFSELGFDDIDLYRNNINLERRQYQLDAINCILRETIGIVNAIMGSGKCLGKDTPIIMFDGTIKKVQDIIAGDTLLGPDGRKRNVLSVTTGKDTLYKITPIKGDPYVTNSVHLLSLKLTSGVQHNFTLSDGTIIDKNDTDTPLFIEASTLYTSNTCKQWLKAWRPDTISFENETSPSRLLIPPYILGIWLGDGTSSMPEITNTDSCIVNEFEKYAISIGCKITDISSDNRTSKYFLSRNTSKTNSFTHGLRVLGVMNNKHIPLSYKRASIKDRLELLAGLLDTDGSMSKNGFDFIQKNKALAEDVVFLCRSLGLAAYMKECTKTIKSINFSEQYYRVSISGDCSIVPVRVGYKKAGSRQQKKNVLRTSITIEENGYGDYYGFEIDGDKQFLLGDWQVTHNTLIAAGVCSHHLSLDKKNKILFIVYDKNILQQTIKNFTKYGFKVSQFGDNVKDLTGDIVVATIQSLGRIIKPKEVLKHVTFTIMDEAHHSKAKSSRTIITKIPNCKYFIGLTATPHIKRSLETAELTSICGPIIYEYGFTEATRDERISPVKAFFLDLPVNDDLKEEIFARKNYKLIWDKGIKENTGRNDMIASILNYCVDLLDTSNLVLVDRIEHGTELCASMRKAPKIVATGLYGANDLLCREGVRNQLADGTINTIVSTVCGEGLDFKISPVIAVNASGRKSFIKLIQFLGRITRPNKKFGKFRAYIDIIDKENPYLLYHSRERMKVCKEFGVDIQICSSVKDFLIALIKYYKECKTEESVEKA